MSIIELSSQQFADQIGVKIAMSKRIIQTRVWKGHALIVTEKKSAKGKPSKFVLWDTETNLPATGEQHEKTHQTPPRPLAQSESALVSVAQNAQQNGTTTGEVRDFRTSAKNSTGLGESHEKAITGTVQTAAPNSRAPSTTVGASHNVISIEFANQRPAAAGVADCGLRGEYLTQTAIARIAEPNPILPAEEKTAVLDGQNLAITTVRPELVEGQSEETPRRFEDLLKAFLAAKKQQGASKNSIKALRSKYRKEFAQTGELPAALIGKESRGRKTSLSNVAVTRFVEIVTQSVELDKSGNPNVTQSLRKVTSFHYQLEQELNQVISLNGLYQLVKSCNLKHYFLKQDDEKAKEKDPSFFPFTPVYQVVQMDGVQTDFIALGDSLENFRFIDCIEFYDFGSRRLMAMNGYFGESNENSVDIFNRFLGGNDFPQADIHIRPDNAKGFVNPRRCITEINNRYARAEGFTFIDDFARPGTPIDKAHLESSHRAFHNFEHHIIQTLRATLPAEKVIGSIKKRKKINDQSYKTITVNIFDISIEEFNAAGMLAKYVTKHNTSRHAFNEDGEKRTWVPEKRYAEYLKTVETFRFTAEDLERNLVYGSTKDSRKVQKGGVIEYKTRGYQTFTVEKPDMFNSHSNTSVQISYLGNGKLAVFSDGKDGAFICYAYALKAPVKSEKIIAIEQSKKEKAVAGGSYSAIVAQFAAIGLSVNETMLRDLISQGLSIEMTATIIAADNSVKYGDGTEKSNGRRWLYFCGAAKDAINNKNRASGATRNTL